MSFEKIFKEIILLIKMVDVSTNHMQSNGYRLNVENSKYLIFESEDYSKKYIILKELLLI